MAGGAVFQLAYTGLQDKFLTKKPEMTFFKQVYYRYSNFAIEPMTINFRENIGFGKSMNMDIPKNGDMLYKMHLRVTLPALKLPMGSTYVGWTNSIGNALIKRVCLKIGDSVIDQHSGAFLDVYDDLTVKRGDGDNSSILLGKYNILESTKANAATPLTLYIPLRFWFTKDISQCLPIISLQFHKITLQFDFRDFGDLVTYDGNVAPSISDLVNADVVAEYIFLDDTERNGLKVKDHQFLINQIQTSSEQITAGSVQYKSRLAFNHPVYELIFTFSDLVCILNNDYFNYSVRNLDVNIAPNPFLNKAQLLLDGKSRTEMLPELYLRIVNSSRYHTNVPSGFVYVMPFCNQPEAIYPNGSLNFSKVSEAILNIQLREPVPDCTLTVYALNWNVFNIRNGMAGLLFNS